MVYIEEVEGTPPQPTNQRSNPVLYTIQQKTPTGWVDLEQFEDVALAWQELDRLERRWPSAQFRWVRPL